MLTTCIGNDFCTRGLLRLPFISPSVKADIPSVPATSSLTDHRDTNILGQEHIITRTETPKTKNQNQPMSDLRFVELVKYRPHPSESRLCLVQTSIEYVAATSQQRLYSTTYSPSLPIVRLRVNPLLEAESNLPSGTHEDRSIDIR
jgi:hypothetical protein